MSFPATGGTPVFVSTHYSTGTAVVAFTQTVEGITTAAVWTADGGVVTVGLPDESYSRVWGLNSDGTALTGESRVIGVDSGSLVKRAFVSRWDTEEYSTPYFQSDLLTVPGGMDSVGISINRFGEVVGTQTAEGNVTAVLWRSFEESESLDLLSNAELDGFHCLSPLIINDNREILVKGRKGGREMNFVLTPDPDTDGDGMSDAFENLYGFSPYDASDGGADTDGDGLTSLQEFLNGTDPEDNDSDGDTLLDGWEVQWGLDPRDSNDETADPDGDSVPNWREQELLTAPVGLYRLSLDELPDSLQDGALTILSSDSNGNHLVNKTVPGESPEYLYLSSTVWGGKQVITPPSLDASGNLPIFHHMDVSGRAFGKVLDVNGEFSLVSWAPGEEALNVVLPQKYSFLNVKSVSPNGKFLLLNSSLNGQEGWELSSGVGISSFQCDWYYYSADYSLDYWVMDNYVISNEGKVIGYSYVDDWDAGSFGVAIHTISSNGFRELVSAFEEPPYISSTDFFMIPRVNEEGKVAIEKYSSGLEFSSSALITVGTSDSAGSTITEGSPRVSQSGFQAKIQNDSSLATTLKGEGYLERAGASLKISKLPILAPYQAVTDPRVLPRAEEILPGYTFPLSSASLSGDVHGLSIAADGTHTLWTLSNVTDYNNDGLPDDWQTSLLAY